VSPGAPLATGGGAGSSSSSAKASPRGLTPIVATAITRFALPLLCGLVLLTALAVLEITKRPRRAATGASAGPPVEDVLG
jgi:hypothetical protein